MKNCGGGEKMKEERVNGEGWEKNYCEGQGEKIRVGI